MRPGFVACLLLAVLSCKAEPQGLEPSPHGINILFIGNSLTYSNDLPATVAAIAKAAGDTLHAGSITAANFALIDHVKGSNALDVIRRGGWDFVVVQQGPTSTGPGIDRDTLVIATRLIDEAARAAGARTAVFMVWPPSSRLAFFDNVRDAYREAAAAVNGVFLPAGEAWRKVWETDPQFPLYSSDSFHPSATGTFLAALVIYEGLTGRDARELPARAFANGRDLALSSQVITMLQAAAHQAVVEAQGR